MPVKDNGGTDLCRRRTMVHSHVSSEQPRKSARLNPNIIAAHEGIGRNAPQKRAGKREVRRRAPA
jgi:hypothetical protein